MTDVERIEAHLRFDAGTQQAEATATVELVADGPGSGPGLDLRQAVDLPGDLRGGRHRLEFRYPLAVPDAEGAVPVDWRGDGVRFDFWMSDLETGRYLEQWIPAPLIHDRFTLEVTVEVAGARPHAVVSNALSEKVLAPNHWRLSWGAGTTALSPMLVVAPADELEWWRGAAAGLDVRVARFTSVDADVAACGEDVAGWLTYLTARYGPWAHEAGAFTALLWDSGRGMEYDGATTSSVRALEHEVFHSWFGRGVKPATAADGWIDEAFTTWATTSGRSALPRFAVLSPAEALEAVAEPAALYPPDPADRRTPREAYAQGAVLFAGVAGVLGGADRLRSAMGAWYRANAGGLVTTDGLRASLEAWGGVDLGALWEPLVRGRP